MSLYKGNATGLAKEDVGIWPQPHYWWEGGAAWGGMIEYSQISGDDSHVKALQQALTSNYGPKNDFILDYRRSQTVRKAPKPHERWRLTVDPRAATTNASGPSPP